MISVLLALALAVPIPIPVMVPMTVTRTNERISEPISGRWKTEALEWRSSVRGSEWFRDSTTATISYGAADTTAPFWCSGLDKMKVSVLCPGQISGLDITPQYLFSSGPWVSDNALRVPKRGGGVFDLTMESSGVQTRFIVKAAYEGASPARAQICVIRFVRQ